MAEPPAASTRQRARAADDAPHRCGRSPGADNRDRLPRSRAPPPGWHDRDQPCPHHRSVTLSNCSRWHQSRVTDGAHCRRNAERHQHPGFQPLMATTAAMVEVCQFSVRRRLRHAVSKSSSGTCVSAARVTASAHPEQRHVRGRYVEGLAPCGEPVEPFLCRACLTRIACVHLQAERTGC